MEKHELERMNRLARKVHVLEQQLAHLYRHLGLTYQPDADLDAVGQAIAAGNMIEAIKLYRANTGVDLATAKAAVDALAAQLGFA